MSRVKYFKAGRINIDQEVLVGILGLSGGEIHHIAYDSNRMQVVVVVFHKSMPRTEINHPIPQVDVVVRREVGEVKNVLVRVEKVAEHFGVGYKES